MKVHTGEQAHCVHASKHRSNVVIALVVPLVAAPAGRAVPLHVEDVGIERPVAFGESCELLRRVRLEGGGHYENKAEKRAQKGWLVQ